MAWLKLEETFHGHPKFRRLGRALGVSHVTAKGHVATLWSWSLRYAPDGDLSGLDIEDIADAADWEDDPKIFVDALVKAGLIDGDTRDGYAIHEWMERAGSYREATRKAAQRARKKEAEAAAVRAESVATVTTPGEVKTPSNAPPKTISRVEPVAVKAPPASPPGEVQSIWDTYREVLSPSAGLLVSSEGLRVIGEALTRRSADDLKASLQGHRRNPWRTEQAGRVRIGALLGSDESIAEGLDWLTKAGVKWTAPEDPEWSSEKFRELSAKLDLDPPTEEQRQAVIDRFDSWAEMASATGEAFGASTWEDILRIFKGAA